MSEEDHFADVRGQLQGNMGCLAGEGVDAHYSAPEKLTDSGVGYQVGCDNCGHRHFIVVTWDEFIYGLNRMIPPKWGFSQQVGAFHPNTGCRQCQAMIPLFIRPDECSRQIKAGVMANKLTQEYLGKASQALRQRAAQHRR